MIQNQVGAGGRSGAAFFSAGGSACAAGFSGSAGAASCGSSAASLARQGITTQTFPEGTIFTVAIHPLRDGRTFGTIAGLLISCGTAMPKGGCTKETGKVLISSGNADGI